jgi:hypothetical protein
MAAALAERLENTVSPDCRASIGLACIGRFKYHADEMSATPAPGEFEQSAPPAVLRLRGRAYGAPSPGALPTARLGDPTPPRGGRARRRFRVRETGAEAVARAQRSYQRLLKGPKLPGAANA